jgi:hypothetical protein
MFLTFEESPVKKTTLIFALALSTLLIASCGEKATTTTHEDAAAKSTPAAAGQQAVTTNANLWTGEIVETMDSGGYTYVLLDTGSEKIWAASPVTAVKVGQKASVPKGMMMTNFASKTLDRTFDEIYFVEGIYPVGGMPAGDHPKAEHPTSEHPGSEHPQAEHPGSTMGGGHTNTKVEDAAVEGVAKVAGGHTVAEIFAQSSALSGQTVKVRGKVVKFSANIMGTNWVHIQDGTKGDLTVTTDAVVATGDLVVVEGPLTVNKDFGAGYKYDAIIEKATVTKE